VQESNFLLYIIVSILALSIVVVLAIKITKTLPKTSFKMQELDGDLERINKSRVD